MDDSLGNMIRQVLSDNRVMTLATLRPDGWPQATSVGFAYEGLTLYFLCGPQSQKALNIARDGRVSVTVDHDTEDVMDIRALSMAAKAERVTDPAEATRLIALLLSRYPEQKSMPADFAIPTPDEIAIFRVRPKVISVIDYSKGFGHTDLVTV